MRVWRITNTTGNECKALPLERNYGSENQERETMADAKLRQRGFLANNPQTSTSYGGESMAPTHIEILQPKERHVGRGEWEEQKEKQQQHEEDQRMAARQELHDGLSFPQYMLAGSVAGMVEHMAMFPVDLVKTRMQMLDFGHRGVYRAFFSIVKKEGPMGLYRGIGAMGLGAGPAHAVYFAVYETVKQKLGGNRVGHHPLLHAMAGACATVASDAVFTPMDVVKQRLQLRRSPYRGVFDCMQRILKEEGVHAFYKSYPTTILMNIPFTAVHFAAYEAGKKILGELYPEYASEEHLAIHLTAGGVAGALASAVTTPLDVIKTRLQCQGVCGAERYSSGSVREAARRIINQEGPAALLRGVRARVLFHTPAAAICWSTYEAAKQFLQKWNEEHRPFSVPQILK